MSGKGGVGKRRTCERFTHGVVLVAIPLRYPSQASTCLIKQKTSAKRGLGSQVEALAAGLDLAAAIGLLMSECSVFLACLFLVLGLWMEQVQRSD